MTTDALATVDAYDDGKIDLIRRTICKGATGDELQLFIHQCKRTGLDPFSRQIHAVKRWDKSQGREVMAIQTGIDGYRLIAERTGKYAGNDDPQYDREDAEHPGKATVTVWKMLDGQRVAFTRSARWSEFVQTTKDGTPTRFWQKMPYLMLGKVAEALALRSAFPQELSGLYTSEEMGQADNGHVEHHAEPVKALPAGGQHEPPKEIDRDLVNSMERVLRAATGNPDGLAAAAKLVKQNGDKITPAGRQYLLGVYDEVKRWVPPAQTEPGEFEPAEDGAGEVAF